MVLIESLDDDGYLADPLEEIAERLADMLGARPTTRGARGADATGCSCALKWLQSLEPTGVGARDLAECLMLQLRALPRSAAQTVAMQHLRAATWSCWRGAT